MTANGKILIFLISGLTPFPRTAISTTESLLALANRGYRGRIVPADLPEQEPFESAQYDAALGVADESNVHESLDLGRKGKAWVVFNGREMGIFRSW